VEIYFELLKNFLFLLLKNYPKMFTYVMVSLELFTTIPYFSIQIFLSAGDEKILFLNNSSQFKIPIKINPNYNISKFLNLRSIKECCGCIGMKESTSPS